jgi:Cytochrome c7 and related cytochrome c
LRVSQIFPKWMNALPTAMAVLGVGGFGTVIAGVYHYFTPEFWEVGYMPTQPGTGFNHQLHAGKLGLDCKYCHTNVEKSAEANIPPVSTCYGCHAENHVNLGPGGDAKVQFIRDAYSKDESIPWKRIHKLPDYVRNFPHHAHVNAGVSCYSCHGQITAMPVVFQAESLSMAWCLDCHRGVGKAIDGKANAGQWLVPQDKITNLKWVEEEWMSNLDANAATSKQLLEAIKVKPPQGCGACHY